MRRIIKTLVLALLIGFVSYRAALVVMPIEDSGKVATCTNGTVFTAHFNLVTGFPFASGCTNSDGGGWMYTYPGAPVIEHWFRSLLFGLGVAALAFVALWRIRRRPTGLRLPSEALPSAG